MDYKSTRKIMKNLLKCFEYHDLIFFAERCIDEGNSSHETIYFLALAYQYVGKLEKSLSLLQEISTPSPDTSFLYLKLLFKTKKYAQVEKFIHNKPGACSNDDLTLIIGERFGEYAGSALKIIAQTQKIVGNVENCKKLFHSSLEFNPFLWSNVEILCHMRSSPDFAQILNWPTTSAPTGIPNSLASISLKIPSDSSIKFNSDNSPEFIRTSSRLLKSTPLNYNRRKFPVKESTRVKKSKWHNKIDSDHLTPICLPKSEHMSFEASILNAYSSIGHLLNLCENYVPSIQNELKLIPERHRDSSYILACVGASLFHQKIFSQAQFFFDLVISRDCSWTKHMDECSSNLWQLNDVNKLEHLVEILSSMSPLDPETWIAAGNLASLKKRHQKAISFFKRARYIDPFNPYPHTLISQELHITDGGFQESVLKGVIHMDSFHYQAWYFLGRIKAQQQKFDEALTYLGYSSDINPRNTVILSLIAYCFLKSKKYKNSLEIIQRAIDIDSENLLLKFERATIFFEMNNFRECLTHLEPLLKSCRFDCGVNLLAAKTFYALEMLPESIESASKIINQNKANPFAELEARELLKSIGMYQNSQSSRINNLTTSPIIKEISAIAQNSNMF